MKNRNYTGFFNNSKNAPVLKRKKEKIAKEKKDLWTVDQILDSFKVIFILWFWKEDRDREDMNLDLNETWLEIKIIHYF